MMDSRRMKISNSCRQVDVNSFQLPRMNVFREVFIKKSASFVTAVADSLFTIQPPIKESFRFECTAQTPFSNFSLSHSVREVRYLRRNNRICFDKSFSIDSICFQLIR